MADDEEEEKRLIEEADATYRRSIGLDETPLDVELRFSFVEEQLSQPWVSTAADYTEDWNEVAAAVRVRKSYVCDLCKVDVSSNRLYYHVHHVTRDKSDNSPQNLLGLCALCHSTREQHTSGVCSPLVRALILNLRATQGLPKYPF